MSSGRLIRILAIDDHPILLGKASQLLLASQLHAQAGMQEKRKLIEKMSTDGYQKH